MVVHQFVIRHFNEEKTWLLSKGKCNGSKTEFFVLKIRKERIGKFDSIWTLLVPLQSNSRRTLLHELRPWSLTLRPAL